MERQLHSGSMDNYAKAQGLKGPCIQRRPAWPSVRAAVDGPESQEAASGWATLWRFMHWATENPNIFSASGTGLIDKNTSLGKYEGKI